MSFKERGVGSREGVVKTVGCSFGDESKNIIEYFGTQLGTCTIGYFCDSKERIKMKPRDNLI